MERIREARRELGLSDDFEVVMVSLVKRYASWGPLGQPHGVHSGEGEDKISSTELRRREQQSLET